jgi:hypothetical protein
MEMKPEFIKLILFLNASWQKFKSGRVVAFFRQQKPLLNSTWTYIKPILVSALITLSIYLLLFKGIPYLQSLIAELHSTRFDLTTVKMTEKEAVAYVKNLEREISTLARKMNRLQPLGNFIVVNTHENSFRLYKNSKLYREGKCSTGSYVLLESGEEQKWIFKTPQGMHRIQGKISDPVWRKPDWAFIEEGLPVPSPTHHTRYEYGVLGDYAMSIGDGYLIHGTLYKRYIGLPVTHGCIRLNDDDLESVFRTLEVGARVYIF